MNSNISKRMVRKVIRPSSGVIDILRRRGQLHRGGFYIESIEGVPAPFSGASDYKALKETLVMAQEINELIKKVSNSK